MKALIVDDETLARKRILNLLREVPEINQIEECSNGRTAVRTIPVFNPDIIFLDINLQDMSGFDVLNNIKIQSKPSIIFVTAYDSFALQAFDFDAFDFLLKPFKEERFFKAISKVIRTTRNEANKRFEERIETLLNYHQLNSQQETYLKRIPVKLGNKTTLLETTSIRYICASGCYAEIFTDQNKYLVRESLNNFDQTLSDDFFRIHRSTIVNLNFIQEIIHSDYAEIDVKMNDKTQFSVSKSQKKEFLKKLGLK